MGNYLFKTESLVQEVVKDAANEESAHDFGRSIIPEMYKRSRVFVYDFTQNVIPGQEERERGYWRDVGSIDTYYQSNMDLVEVHPIFNLYNNVWPIYTDNYNFPPAKFVFADEEHDRDTKSCQLAIHHDLPVGAVSSVAVRLRVCGAIVIVRLPDDLEVRIEADLDHVSVGEADLHPVHGAVVAGLGVDDGPATRVLERSRRGLVQSRASERLIVATPRGDGHSRAPTDEGDGQRAAPDPPGPAIHQLLLSSHIPCQGVLPL